MNHAIKTILEKNNIILNYGIHGKESDLHNAIIEICEEQKKQCAKDLDCPTLPSIAIASIIHSKNIAE